MARQLIVAGCVTAMVATLCVAPLARAQPSSTTNVTAAACRAAGMAPEILGIDNIEESGQFISSDKIESQSDLTVAKLTGWAYPKYLLMGSDYNTNANRFMYNIEQNNPSILYNGSRAGSGRGPNQALKTLTADTDDDTIDASDLAILNSNPDIVVGTGLSTNKDVAEDAVYSAFGAKGVTYSFKNNDEMCDIMYDLADKADTIVNSNASKTLRYGTASTIALKYEKFIKGTKGLILQAINDSTNIEVTKRKIALVTARNTVTDSDGNNSYTYTIMKTGTTDGTANQNRYLETCANITENIADILLGSSTASTVDVTESQLDDADLVLIGGQTGSSVNRSDMPSSVQNRTYQLTSNSAASGYGVVMNSPENAQNIARILGILYPEVVSQANFIAYYFQTFYHINVPETGGIADYTNLKTVLKNALNGYVPKRTSVAGSEVVLSYASDVWTDSDFSGYSQSTVQGLIDQGCSYITGLIAADDDVPDELVPAHGTIFTIPPTSSN